MYSTVEITRQCYCTVLASYERTERTRKKVYGPTAYGSVRYDTSVVAPYVRRSKLMTLALRSTQWTRFRKKVVNVLYEIGNYKSNQITAMYESRRTLCRRLHVSALVSFRLSFYLYPTSRLNLTGFD